MAFRVLALVLSATSVLAYAPWARRAWLGQAGSAVASLSVPSTVLARAGDGANYGIPDKSEADAMMGARADSFGDASRENSAYALEKKALLADQAKIDALVVSKLKALAEIEGRINAKIGPALAKKAWPKVVEVLNAELYAFKGTITDITKARSGGKVCQDAPKRGAGDAGEGCALLLVQTAVLQDINEVFRFSQIKDIPKAAASYSKFQADFDRFLASAK